MRPGIKPIDLGITLRIGSDIANQFFQTVEVIVGGLVRCVCTHLLQSDVVPSFVQQTVIQGHTVSDITVGLFAADNNTVLHLVYRSSVPVGHGLIDLIVDVIALVVGNVGQVLVNTAAAVVQRTDHDLLAGSSLLKDFVELLGCVNAVAVTDHQDLNNITFLFCKNILDVRNVPCGNNGLKITVHIESHLLQRIAGVCIDLYISSLNDFLHGLCSASAKDIAGISQQVSSAVDGILRELLVHLFAVRLTQNVHQTGALTCVLACSIIGEDTVTAL